MEFYIYQADTYCPECTAKIKKDRAHIAVAIAKRGDSVDDERTYDSEEWPKGPFDDEEHDMPQHCVECLVFLEQPLTTAGYQYVSDTIQDAITTYGKLTKIEKQWLSFYGEDTPCIPGSARWRTLRQHIYYVLGRDLTDEI